MTVGTLPFIAGTNICLKLCGRNKLSEKVQNGITLSGHLLDHALVIGVIALGVIGLVTQTFPLFSIGLMGAGIGYGVYVLLSDLVPAIALLAGPIKLAKELTPKLTPGAIIIGHIPQVAIVVGAIAIGVIGLLTHIFPLFCIGLIGFGVGCGVYAFQQVLMLSYQYIENKLCK